MSRYDGKLTQHIRTRIKVEKKHNWNHKYKYNCIPTSSFLTK